MSDAPLLVSATRFTYRRIWHMPGVFANGMKLYRMWPEFEGSVGVSIAADLVRRTTYTISVWRSEEDLMKFIGHPLHRVIMNEYRERIESSSAATWQVETFSLAEAWSRACATLTGMPNVSPASEHGNKGVERV